MNKTTNDWRSLSEVCFGLIITGRVDKSKFCAAQFVDAYEEGFTEWHKSKNKTAIAKILGADYETAIQAADTISEDSAHDIEWHKLLDRSYKSYQVGDKASKIGKKLMQGYTVSNEDAVNLATQFKDLANPDSLGLTVSNTIDTEAFEPTELCGYPPIDTHLGGIVKSGNILVMGMTSVGKSLFSQQFWGHWLEKYPERKVAIYSLEMTNQQYLSRGLKLYPKFRKAHEEGRVLVSDKTTNIYDIGIESASAGVDAIVVDYIDYLVHGEGSESKYAEIYIEMNNISRSMDIPFMMLLQPNRQSYTSGVPKMYHARYSGMAENVSAQFWALWKPQSEEDCNGDFTFVEDSYYIVAWKQRFGWLTSELSKELGLGGKAKRGPGAIVLPDVRNVWATETGEWLRHGDVPQTTKKTRRKE